MNYLQKYIINANVYLTKKKKKKKNYPNWT